MSSCHSLSGFFPLPSGQYIIEDVFFHLFVPFADRITQIRRRTIDFAIRTSLRRKPLGDACGPSSKSDLSPDNCSYTQHRPRQHHHLDSNDAIVCVASHLGLCRRNLVEDGLFGWHCLRRSHGRVLLRQRRIPCSVVCVTSAQRR